MSAWTPEHEPSAKGLFQTPSNGLAFNARRKRKRSPRQNEGRPPKDLSAEKASLAEYVAQGGSVSAWGREHGVPQTTASRYWRAIVADMGEQAR